MQAISGNDLSEAKNVIRVAELATTPNAVKSVPTIEVVLLIINTKLSLSSVLFFVDDALSQESIRISLSIATEDPLLIVTARNKKAEYI